MTEGNSGTMTETGSPIEPRILAILADNDWHSRRDIAKGLNHRYGPRKGGAKTYMMGPADVHALNRLLDKGAIEQRVIYTRGLSMRTEYRIVPSASDLSSVMQQLFPPVDSV
jgi:hypothetical protein